MGEEKTPSVEDIVKGIKDTVSAEVKSAVDSLRKESADTAEKKAAINVEVNEPVPSFLTGGGFFKSVYQSSTDPSVRVKLLEGLAHIKAPSGNNTLVDSEGGFLVHDQISNSILESAYESSSLATFCDKMPIGPGANALVWPEFNDSNRATAGSVGGFRAYRVNEASAATYSKANFKENRCEVSKIMVSVPATDEALEDAVQLEGIISRMAPVAIGDKLDDEVWNGTGGMQCQGILNSPSLVTVAIESGQTIANPVVSENIDNMFFRMPARNRRNAYWVINNDLYPHLQGLSRVVGTGGVPVWLPPGGLSQTPNGTLYGRPVIDALPCSAKGSVGDIAFVDFSEYALADKGGIQQAVSMHVLFLTAEQVFRFTYRVNGMPKRSSAITIRNSSNTLSPFVTLAARS